MAANYRVLKAITNNVVRAKQIGGGDVILTGRGIGYGRRPDDIISSAKVERTYLFYDPKEVSSFDMVVKNNSPFLIELANNAITYIQNRYNRSLSERIHTSLTDHISFLIRRYKMGIPINNPFSYETAAMYPKETKIARGVVAMINRELNLDIPDEETGFITLHIISALEDDSFFNISKIAELISECTVILEKNLGFSINRSSLHYSRFATHIRFMIMRLIRRETLEVPPDMEKLMELNYPEYVKEAKKIAMVIQERMQLPVQQSEISYITIHIANLYAQTNKE